ncbi:hypothetical protein ANCDUO_18165 [Ancylostoma duodenale]|uniref:Uncharacterized protein n=1 Tax=Ancylostoma duodenale TaxID=51022 RepID=A0A0C2CPN6_9BILA|nr:hypothetical protein ANCDUO_18165 [Ancylostoma duodenale]
MVRANERNNSDKLLSQEIPIWAGKLIDKYEKCANRMQEAMFSSFEKTDISMMSNTPAIDQNALYSMVVKVRADEGKIEEKFRRITWEQNDEASTKKFDYQALKEVVETSWDFEVIKEFSGGRITSHRFPSDQPKCERPREDNQN